MRTLSLTTLFALLLSLNQAQAHARLETPVPRSTNSGITTGPCGTDAHTSPNVYQAGSVLNITWEETIHHSGSFQIYFSASSDQNLSTGASVGSKLLYQVNQSFKDGNVPHQYSAQVALPTTPCTGCAIQLVQLNTDHAPNTVYYFSCADVQLTANIPAPTATPTPAPAPSPSCSNHPGGPVPTFTSINSTIIQPICLHCHSGGAQAAAGGHDFSTYAGVMAVVNTANPALSLIYTVTSDGAMPQAVAPAVATPLTPAQEGSLLQWIQAGAPNN